MGLVVEVHAEHNGAKHYVELRLWYSLVDYI